MTGIGIVGSNSAWGTRAFPVDYGFSEIRATLEKNGGDDETRTRDLCRDSGPVIGFTITYKTAGTAKGRPSRSKPHKALHPVGWVVGWSLRFKC
jgi:hypothetical protein